MEKLVVKIPGIEEQKKTNSRGRGRPKKENASVTPPQVGAKKGRCTRNSAKTSDNIQLPVDYKMVVVDKKPTKGYVAPAPENKVLTEKLETFFNERAINYPAFCEHIQKMSGDEVLKFFGIKGSNQKDVTDGESTVKDPTQNNKGVAEESVSGQNQNEDTEANGVKSSNASEGQGNAINSGESGQNEIQVEGGEENGSSGKVDKTVTVHETDATKKVENENNKVNAETNLVYGQEKKTDKTKTENGQENGHSSQNRNDARFNVQILNPSGDDKDTKEDERLLKSVVNCEVNLGQRVPNRSPVKVAKNNNGEIDVVGVTDDDEEMEEEEYDEDSGGVYITDSDEITRLESLNALQKLNLNEEEFDLGVESIELAFKEAKAKKRSKNESINEQIQNENENHDKMQTVNAENGNAVDAHTSNNNIIIQNPPSVTRVQNTNVSIDSQVEQKERKVRTIKDIVQTVSAIHKTVNKRGRAVEKITPKKSSPKRSESLGSAEKKEKKKGTTENNRRSMSQDSGQSLKKTSLFERTLPASVRPLAEALGAVKSEQLAAKNSASAMMTKESSGTDLVIISEQSGDGGGVTDGGSGETGDETDGTIDYVTSANGDESR